MRNRFGKALSVVALVALSACGPRPAPARHDGDWLATWASPAQPPGGAPSGLKGQTVRQVVRVSLGGRRWRLKLSNAFGKGEARIDDVRLALAGDGAATAPGSDRPVTFGGASSVSLAPGQSRYSDPVDLPAPSLAKLTISLHVAESRVPSQHAEAWDPIFAAPGDQAGRPTLTGAKPLEKRPFLTEIDVAAPASAHAVALLGDSLTDGRGSSPGAFHRWSDRLGERLVISGGGVAVVNAGIGGNRLLHALVGPPALRRLDPDALDLPGVSRLVVLEGSNDFGIPGLIGRPGEAVQASDVEDAYRQIIRRAHARGIKVIGATLPPFSASADWAGYWSPRAAAERQAVNQWIRTSGAFDAVVDFDAVLRDPRDPGRQRPAFDSGDHLHPNDAGYAAMAQAVDLRLLR